MKKTLISVSVSLVIFCLASLTQIIGKPYGMAGCGLGALIFEDKPGGIQILAATTNETLSSQTFAISSGTSNCHDDGILLAQAEQEIYVESNIESLRIDMAKGNGETIESLAFLMGCSTESRSLFGQTAQSKYDQIFVEENNAPEWVHYRIKEVVRGDKTLSRSCSLVPKY